MSIPILLILLIVISFIIDIVVRDLDLTSLTVLAVTIIALIFSFEECYYVVLALPMKYMVYIVIRKDIVKVLGLKHVVALFIQPAMYIVFGIAVGLTVQRIAGIPLNPWAMKIIFTLCIYLALSLTVSPSLTALITPIRFLLIDIELLNKILYLMAISIGMLCAFYALPFIGFYMIIPLIVIAIMWFYRKRIGFVWRYITALLFFLSILIIISLKI